MVLLGACAQVQSRVIRHPHRSSHTSTTHGMCDAESLPKWPHGRQELRLRLAHLEKAWTAHTRLPRVGLLPRARFATRETCHHESAQSLSFS